ncbi:ABC-2 type transport system permease protein [Dysgonomonas alginatilytica]|uniref:ABC-2 type transport system permease protein n=1 Tax=Dysgonomonas alginatilytica TaxID=1605892 RepID=A0A2V3PL44_9BACT|nr:ABC transporter permease [Dysgonomonas alginatilytica]PXV62493.1 ABC-2 type transport system permease protein [Dysgonomonas alginatilytica]
MKKLLLDIYYVWLHELKVVFRDPAVVLLFLIVPLAYPVLYAFLYNNEAVHEVKVIVVDESNSALSREFTRKVDGAADVNVVAHVADMEEAREAVRRKEAYGIIYIPASFSIDLNTAQQTAVLVYSDMSSMLFYKAMLLTCMEVSLEMGADIRVNDMGHGTRAQDASTMEAVDYEWVSFYNVSNGFASFLVPAILILVIQQTLLLGIGTIVGTHNDKKRFTVASHMSEGKNIHPLKLTIGKGFCYSTLYIITSAWVLRVVPYLFNLPQIGDPLTIAVFLFPYILAATFFAMTLSYFCSQREFVMLLVVFTSVPFLFMSGISWPWVSIPPVLKAIAYLLPSTPGIHGFVSINTMGATLSDVWFEYVVLWVQVVVYWALATMMYYWWIDNYDPKYKGKHPSMSKF